MGLRWNFVVLKDKIMRNYKYWIALEQVQGIGPAHLSTIYDILKKNDLSIIDIFDLTPREMQDEFSLPEKIASAFTSAKNIFPRVEEDYFRIIESEIDIILFFEEEYPKALCSHLSSFPPILYVLGNRDILSERGAAILGDKDISERGNLISYLSARELVKHRISIISGFARGAGLSAHRSALENKGTSIAVLPHGMFHFTMPDMLKDVFDPERFLIISPFYPTMEFDKYNAYKRNRIICALSNAVYIVESPPEGGIFEAGKSANHIGVPLFVTEYGNYPKSAAGNKSIIETLGGIPIRGRMVDNILTPNLDQLIGTIKYPPEERKS